MTATAEPPLRPVEAPSEAVLDRAEGVELLGDVHGSGYKDGAALVRRADGQMVQLGPLMYAVLDCVDGRRTTAELADCLSEREGRRFDVQHVARLAEKLAEQGLLAGTEHKAPPRRNPLLALRWKVLVTNPAVTRRLTTPFTFLFRPFVVVPVVAAFVAVLWFVLVHKGVAAATADAFHKPELLLLVFALAVASAGFHEIGHASACRYGGAEPAGMGMGIYMVWPAFYTDVTDAYRLPRRDRLRVDLGGIYFNAIVAVATMGVWLAWHVDALLLLIAIQLLEMVKNLSPVIRSDGYHILSDATGVPDLYFHIGPTLRRLLPWRRMEPSALSGRARLLVTAWVLVVVPVLLSLMLGAILLLPHLLASTWESTRTLGSAVPHEAAHGHGLAVLTSLLRLFALVLPVVGSVLITQKIVRMLVAKGRSWSAGSPPRRVLALAAGAAVCAGAAFAWWPAGQYQPVRAEQHGTIASFGAWIAAPQQAARPAAAPPAPVHITPGTHLAVSMIPVGGATKEHPAMFVIAGQDGQPAVAILTDTTPADATATTTDTTTTTTTATTTTSSGGSAPVQAAAFAFTLPSKPGPGDSQALSVNTTSGGVKYDVAYSLVTISDGSPVTNKNSAFAFANCVSCTTVAVSFQVVLIVGQSNRIAPINAAGALNGNCTACMTTAIADQIVITLRSVPSQELLQRLQDALQQLNALPALGANGTPAAVAAVVAKVQQQIDDALAQSGLVANPPPTTTASTATATTATATTGSTATAPAVTATTPTLPATTSSSTTTSTRTATTATTTTTPATTSTAGTTTGATTTTTG